MTVCCVSRLMSVEPHAIDYLMMSDTGLYLTWVSESDMPFSVDDDDEEEFETTSDDDDELVSEHDDILVGMWGHLIF